ncbi:MAG: hypothetical protein QXW01_02675 [Candidatus Aenigmatarchaeota archaeon]
MLRAFNRNQLLILSQVAINSGKTISSLLIEIEKGFRIPLSTLKLNARILRDLKLISFGNSNPARLTSFGKLIIEILDLSNDGRLMS